jgi:methenyltetrahydrofolate cyclohydrolase
VTSSLADKTLHDVLAAFSSAAPTPGGGSACAAGAAIGVALLIKVASVANVPLHALAGVEAQLVDAMDDDASAYQHVIAARRQPRESQAERTLRTVAIQKALRHATDVPLGIMRLTAEALSEARLLAERIRPSTAADAAVAVMLLRAGFDGARMTVEANVGGLADAEYVRTAHDRCRRLSEDAARAAEEIERLLRIV